MPFNLPLTFSNPWYTLVTILMFHNAKEELNLTQTQLQIETWESLNVRVLVQTICGNHNVIVMLREEGLTFGVCWVSTASYVHLDLQRISYLLLKSKSMSNCNKPGWVLFVPRLPCTLDNSNFNAEHTCIQLVRSMRLSLQFLCCDAVMLQRGKGGWNFMSK